MRELTAAEVEQVSGGLDWVEGGIAVMALGISGGLATGLLGLGIGGAMLVVGTYQELQT
ncbi:MAG: hypothetical protein HUJ31_18535 [Pseudomonadales bacterium]|nr:hypothetical protein [Pseudomonadales bacterium]